MSNKYIALFDSGIGGIFLLSKLSKAFPNERFIYLGDNLNAPYGSKSPSKLLSLSALNLSLIKDYPIKALILACNTLSVTVRRDLEQCLNVPVFGVFPPLFGLEKDKSKTLLIATPLTCSQFIGFKGVTTLSLPSLALDIEKNAPYFDKVNFTHHLHDANFNFNLYKFAFDRVVLGCTHYDFIKNQIFDHFYPKNIISSTTFTFNMVSKFIKCTKSSVNCKRFSPLFLGNCADFNYKIYSKVVLE